MGVGVGVGAGVEGFSTATMACSMASDSVDRNCMGLTLTMASFRRARVIPSLLEVANGPWQPAQLLA